MLKKSLAVGVLFLSSMSSFAANTLIEMKTTMGNIEIELFNQQAPITTKNFESYVKKKFYNDTIFHRVIPGFMVQGGGLNVDLQEKPTGQAIINEANNGLKNTRGTVAMARTDNPNSAKSQFFINVADNQFLDYTSENAGYAVFAHVTKGMDIVDQIVKSPTTRYDSYSDVPKKSVKILSMKIKPNKLKK
jgi:peptidyl-prolyl cis-trans isomerase A (cyclophilin A)